MYARPICQAVNHSDLRLQVSGLIPEPNLCELLQGEPKWFAPDVELPLEGKNVRILASGSAQLLPPKVKLEDRKVLQLKPDRYPDLLITFARTSRPFQRSSIEAVQRQELEMRHVGGVFKDALGVFPPIAEL